MSETDSSVVSFVVSILDVRSPYRVSSKSVFVFFRTPSLPIFQEEEDC